jgi:hypothetical protein
MDYSKIYNNLIERAKDRDISGYFEIHHIIPISEGGSNNTDNLVKLTAREHYLAHLLLVFMDCKRTRLNAMWAMMRTSNGQNRYFPSSRIYEFLKTKRAEKMSIYQKNRKHIYNPITLEKKFIKEDTIDEYLKSGWILGTYNKSPTNGKIGIHKPNTKIKKYIDISDLDAYLKEGWVKGLFGFKSSHKWNGSRNGANNPTYGKIAVHNPIIKDRQYIDMELLEDYIKKGYIKGRGPNKYE